MPRAVRARALAVRVSPAVAHFVRTGEYPERDTPEAEGAIELFIRPHEDLWCDAEAAVVAAWADQRPGSRPPLWWRFSAPEPRRQISGEPIERGALHDQVDGEGLPIALAHFAHGGVTFESQGAYLKRLGLLREGERVKASQLRPETFEAFDPDVDDAA